MVTQADFHQQQQQQQPRRRRSVSSRRRTRYADNAQQQQLRRGSASSLAPDAHASVYDEYEQQLRLQQLTPPIQQLLKRSPSYVYSKQNGIGPHVIPEQQQVHRPNPIPVPNIINSPLSATPHKTTHGFAPAPPEYYRKQDQLYQRNHHTRQSRRRGSVDARKSAFVDDALVPNRFRRDSSAYRGLLAGDRDFDLTDDERMAAELAAFQAFKYQNSEQCFHHDDDIVDMRIKDDSTSSAEEIKQQKRHHHHHKHASRKSSSSTTRKESNATLKDEPHHHVIERDSATTTTSTNQYRYLYQPTEVDLNSWHESYQANLFEQPSEPQQIKQKQRKSAAKHQQQHQQVATPTFFSNDQPATAAQQKLTTTTTTTWHLPLDEEQQQQALLALLTPTSTPTTSVQIPKPDYNPPTPTATKLAPTSTGAISRRRKLSPSSSAARSQTAVVVDGSSSASSTSSAHSVPTNSSSTGYPSSVFSSSSSSNTSSPVNQLYNLNTIASPTSTLTKSALNHAQHNAKSDEFAANNAFSGTTLVKSAGVYVPRMSDSSEDRTPKVSVTSMNDGTGCSVITKQRKHVRFSEDEDQTHLYYLSTPTPTPGNESQPRDDQQQVDSNNTMSVTQRLVNGFGKLVSTTTNFVTNSAKNSSNSNFSNLNQITTKRDEKSRNSRDTESNYDRNAHNSRQTGNAATSPTSPSSTHQHHRSSVSPQQHSNYAQMWRESFHLRAPSPGNPATALYTHTSRPVARRHDIVTGNRRPSTIEPVSAAAFTNRVAPASREHVIPMNVESRNANATSTQPNSSQIRTSKSTIHLSPQVHHDNKNSNSNYYSSYNTKAQNQLQSSRIDSESDTTADSGMPRSSSSSAASDTHSFSEQPSAVSEEAVKRNESLKHIETILKQTRLISEQIDAFQGSKNDPEYIYLNEMLTRYMVQLDIITSEGIEEIRNRRKQALQQIQQYAQQLDRKNSAENAEEQQSDQRRKDSVSGTGRIWKVYNDSRQISDDASKNVRVIPSSPQPPALPVKRRAPIAPTHTQQTTNRKASSSSDRNVRDPPPPTHYVSKVSLANDDQQRHGAVQHTQKITYSSSASSPTVIKWPSIFDVKGDSVNMQEVPL